MSPFCIGSISWYHFFVLLFRWCSPVSAVALFASDLKLADVNPVYEKTSKNCKDNYRLVTILCNISKIFERCMYDQIQLFFDSLLSKHQCEFCRGWNAQNCLISIIEKSKKIIIIIIIILLLLSLLLLLLFISLIWFPKSFGALLTEQWKTFSFKLLSTITHTIDETNSSFSVK